MVIIGVPMEEDQIGLTGVAHRLHVLMRHLFELLLVELIARHTDRHVKLARIDIRTLFAEKIQIIRTLAHHRLAKQAMRWEVSGINQFRLSLLYLINIISHTIHRA